MIQLEKPYEDNTEEYDLFRIVSILWKSKWFLIFFVILSVAIGGLYAFRLATPLYPANAVIALKTKQQNIVDIESVLSNGSSGSEEVNTEVEVIQSRIIVSELVKKLNLINDPEFNQVLNEPNMFNPIVLLKSLFPETAPPTEEEIFNAVVDNVLEKISVINIRKSFVFSISAITENSKKSALIANTLADLYIQNSLDEKFAAAEKANIWLSAKASELKIELEQSELRVKTFSDGTQLINAETLSGLSIQLKDMRDRIIDLEKRGINLSNNLEAFLLARKENDYTKIIELSKPNDLKTSLKKLNNGTLSQKAFHLKVKQSIRQKIIELERIQDQLHSLRESEANFKTDIDRQTEDLVQLQQLQREAQANGLLYESFLSRLKETSIQQGLQEPDSRLLSYAVPRLASAPRKSVILIMSVFLGLLLASAIVFLRELNDNTFRTVESLEAFSKQNILGAIPKINANNRKQILDHIKTNPTSFFSEAVRNFRTSVLMSDIDRPPQIITVTSSVPGEGKTTLSISLAKNISDLGKKVLLMEGDIRKSVFTEYFGTKDHSNYLGVLTGETSLDEAIFTPEGVRFDVLFGRSTSTNAADIFSSEKFTDLINALRKQYDFIIIDTAPVLAVPDARIIGAKSDAIIYNVMWAKTTKSQVRLGLSRFGSVGVRISGLVLNRFDQKEIGEYGYTYEGYHNH